MNLSKLKYASIIGLMLTQSLFQYGCASQSHNRTDDQELKTYEQILQLTLETEELRAYLHKQPDGAAFPIYIADEFISTRSDIPSLVLYGQPVKFIRKEAADSANLKAYFLVTEYSSTDTLSSIQMRYSNPKLVLDASFQSSPSGWRTKGVHLRRRELETISQKLDIYEEIIRLALDEDTLQSYFFKHPDGSPLPVVIADEIFSSRANQHSLEKFGHPIKFITKEIAESTNVLVYFLVTDYSHHEEDADDARIMLDYPIQNITFGALYSRTPATGWERVSVYIGEM